MRQYKEIMIQTQKLSSFEIMDFVFLFKKSYMSIYEIYEENIQTLEILKFALSADACVNNLYIRFIRC